MSDDDTPKHPLLSLRPGASDDKRAADPGTDPLPARYSEALHVAIVRSVAGGNSPTTAATAEGLPPRELAAWRKSFTDGRAHPSIAKFFDDLERGFAVFEAEAVNEIAAGGIEHKKWLLERTRAGAYSRNETITINNELSTIYGKLRAGLTPELYARVLSLISGE